MRISRDQMWMQFAEVAARRATCFRGNVGAVLVRDNNVLSVGYNGPRSGEAHCKGGMCGSQGCTRSVHAEQNAIDRAGKDIAGATLYCTSAPCFSCAGLVVLNRLLCVVYMHPYRTTDGLQLLKLSSIPVYRMTPSGSMIDVATNEILEDS